MIVPWTQRAAAQCELTWLLGEIAPAGEIGRRFAADGPRIFSPGEETQAAAAIASAVEVAAAVAPDRVDALRVALGSIPDPAAVIARAVLGDVLDDVALFELARFIEGAERLRNVSRDYHRSELSVPALPPALVALFDPAHDQNGGFYLGDRFDDRLGPARAAATDAENAFAAAHDRVAAAVAAEAGLDRIRSGEFVLMRDAVAAPPRGVRVLRETPAYYLCELLLDGPALEKLEASDAAQSRVATLEEEVRRALSAHIAAHEGALAELRAGIGRVDPFVARVRFAQRYPVCVPEIVAAAGIEASDASFLPLQSRLRETRRRYVPIALTLEGVGVVTGANMGGKSAALRTCGFLAMCAVLGVPLPAATARLALFDEIAWIGLGNGDEGDGRLLSSFGREVIDVQTVLSARPRRRLVLIDEFARTTTPAEGTALLVAVLDALRASGACVLAATHLWGIATRSGAAHFRVSGPREMPLRQAGALDLDAAIAAIGDVMDYHLVPVHADDTSRGDAIALAGLLGLDPAIVSRARAELLKGS